MSANQLATFALNKAKAMGYSAAATFLSTMFPRDFEAYMISFELCDSEGNTIDYMSFPIMPNDLSVDESMPVNITSTLGGVSVTNANIYVPKSISLSGSFGRNIKLLSRDASSGLGITSMLKNAVSFLKKNETERSYGLNFNKSNQDKEFNQTSKTGYACCKLLQSILNRSYDTDKNGNTNKLYFYNLALGESYLVKAISFKLRQSLSNNAIWEYNLQLKTICPLYLEQNKKGITNKKVALNTALTNSTNHLVKSLSSTIQTKVINKINHAISR